MLFSSIIKITTKKTKHVLCVLAVIGFLACNKSATNSQISLTPSTTTAKVGESVSVALTSTANASSWTVTPAANVTKTYSITTSKVNYFTFNQVGTYTVAVKARSVAYDSTLNQSLDSCWNHGSGSRGNCIPSVDTASVTITVAGKWV